MRTIKCGVVGVGYLGQHHARIYAAMEGAELVGIHDANPERASEIAGKHGCAVYDSPEALAAECEALSIAVPTDLHRDVALAVLPSGCHVMIEKPLCTSLEEAEQILGAARKTGAIVQVGHIEHFNPVISYLETVVDNPRFITADRLAPFNPRGTEVGVVLDLMIHDIGVILQLVKSPIARVEGVGVNVLSRTEDIANARITFENGAVANINTSRVSLKKVREIRVFQPSTYLSLDYQNQTGHLLRKDGMALQKEDIPIERAEPLMLELQHFVKCVRDHEKPKVDAGLGKSALEVALAITAQIAPGLGA